MAIRKKGLPPSQTTHAVTEQADILEREKKALELKKDGRSYRVIGDLLGVSHTQARHDVEHALSYIRDDVATDAMKVRDLELARLDDDLTKLQDIIRGERYIVRDGAGNPVFKPNGEPLYDVKQRAPSVVMQAIDRKLRIAERRAKLLGLDMPLQVEEITPESKVIDAIRNREAWCTYSAILHIYDGDESLASELFRKAGVPIDR